MNTINSSNFLLPNIADKLCSYQKERVSLMINDFIEINRLSLYSLKGNKKSLFKAKKT